VRIPEPTAQECTEHAQVGPGVAAWYPQMGGYVAKALAVPADDSRCLDVYVWHDGDFPFGDGENPVELHHCNGKQFIEFGMFLAGVAQVPS
jgi:hypothetical protein